MLLSDLGMPEMDGCELIRRVRAMERERGGPALPAIMITAYIRSDDRERALAAGFAEHIPKPVEPAQLVAVVERIARRGS